MNTEAGKLHRLVAKPLYPWLVTIYPIVAIAALNSDQVARQSVGLALAGGALGATVLTLGFRLLLRSWHKAALATGVAVALFYAFGPVSGAIEAWALGEGDPSGSATAAQPISLALSAVWAVALIAATMLVRRTQERRIATFATPLNLLAALLLGIAAVQGVTSASQLEPADDIATTTTGETRAANSLPDIYYIILDGYARADVLKQYYGHDNSPFLDALRAEGFAVNERGHANYYWTFLSLASSLNMDYLPGILGQIDPASADRTAAYERIRNNAVAHRLRQHGYRFIHLQSTWGATLTNSHADELIPCGATLFANEFFRTLAEASWLRALAAHASGKLAECHNNNFASVGAVATALGPKFVFAHFILPHHPYLFDRHGNVLRDATIANQFDFQSRLWEQRERYLEQLLYVNGAVLKALSQIKSGSARPPVIVLQSDHGPQLSEGLDEEERWRVRLANLAAFHLPGAPQDLIPQGDSPVNFFRRILGFYLGSDLPPLPNHHFYSWYRRPFGLKDVTELIGSDRAVSAAAESRSYYGGTDNESVLTEDVVCH